MIKREQRHPGASSVVQIAIARLAFVTTLERQANEVAEAMARVTSDIALVIDRDGVIRSVAEGASPLPAECSRWVGQRWVDTASADSRRKIELLLDEAGSGVCAPTTRSSLAPSGRSTTGTGTGTSLALARPCAPKRSRHSLHHASRASGSQP